MKNKEFLKRPIPEDFYDEFDPRGMSTSEHNEYTKAYNEYVEQLKSNNWTLSEGQLAYVKEEMRKAMKKFPEWRQGQAFFNTLYILHPHVADSIRGTKYDPFHNNDVLVLTYCKLLGRTKETDDKRQAILDDLVVDTVNIGMSEFWNAVHAELFNKNITDEERDILTDRIVEKLKNTL